MNNLVIPAAFNSSLSLANPSSEQTTKTDDPVLAISRGTAIVLLIVYAAYRELSSLTPVDTALTMFSQ